MGDSKWHKTRYYHIELLIESEDNNIDSPEAMLLELCQANDIAATNMHHGKLGQAISILASTSKKLRQVTNSSPNNPRIQCRTFAEMTPGALNVPSFVEVPLCSSETSHMFANAIRLRNSDYLANFSTLAAVVHFNLGLARHIQAVQSYERCGTVAIGILKVASGHYKSSVARLQEAPAIVKAAAFRNLIELNFDETESQEYQAQFTDAFSRLDSADEREMFLNKVSSAAAAA